MYKALSSMSKEERELMVQQKMEMMRKKNEEIMKRHAEIEEDKKSADVFSTAVASHRKANPVPNVVVERKPNPRPPRAQRKLEEQSRMNTDQHPPSQDAESKRSQRLSAGDGPPPDPSFNYLSDPFREGNFREDRGNNRGRGDRHFQNKFGGQEFRNTRQGGGQPRRNYDNRDNYSRDQPRSKDDRPMNNRSMSGRDRINYEDWKAERQKIDEERIARQKTASGEWRREWDVDKRFLEEEAQSNQQSGFYRRPSWERGRGGGNNGGENSYKNFSNNSDYPARNDRQDRGRGREHPRGQGHGDYRNSSFDDQQSGGYQGFDRGRGRGQSRGGVRGHGGSRGYPRGILPRRPDRWSSSSTHSDNSVDHDDRAWLEDDATTPARDVTVNVDNTLTINVKASDSPNLSRNHNNRPPFQSSQADGGRANNMPLRMNTRNVGSGRIRPPLPHSDDRPGFPGREHGTRGRGGGRGRFRRGGGDRSPRKVEGNNFPFHSNNTTPDQSTQPPSLEDTWEEEILDPSAETANTDGEKAQNDNDAGQEWEVTQQQLEWQNSETGEWELPEGQVSWKPSAAEEVNEDSWEDVTSGGESLDLSGQSEDVASKINSDATKGEQVPESQQFLPAKEDVTYPNEELMSESYKQRSVSLASGYEEDDEDEMQTESGECVEDSFVVKDNASNLDNKVEDLPSENTKDIQAVVDVLKQEAGEAKQGLENDAEMNENSTSELLIDSQHSSDVLQELAESNISNTSSETKNESTDSEKDKMCAEDVTSVVESETAQGLNTSSAANNSVSTEMVPQADDSNCSGDHKSDKPLENVASSDKVPVPAEKTASDVNLSDSLSQESSELCNSSTAADKDSDDVAVIKDGGVGEALPKEKVAETEENNSEKMGKTSDGDKNVSENDNSRVTDSCGDVSCNQTIAVDQQANNDDTQETVNKESNDSVKDTNVQVSNESNDTHANPEIETSGSVVT